jgi:polyferredoxin
MGRKSWKKRVGPDDSQYWRRGLQAAFLLLNLWIGVEFLLFVWAYEGRWNGWTPARPPGVEGWLPIAGLMSTKYFLETGSIPSVHPAAMVLILTFLGLSLVFRKAFCGWLCPVGAFSEWLWKLGRETFRRSFFAPKWLDIPLRSLKYLLLAAFLYAVVTMDARSIGDFLRSPYGLVADVKMLNFFRYLTGGAAVFLGVLIVASIFIPNAWCRYLCPYGALMGLAAVFSPLRVRREAVACIDCGKCAKVCPSHLPVDRLVQIRSAECIGCMECVAICPAEGALAMTMAAPGRRWALSGRMVALSLTAIFLTVYAGARLTGNWESAIPDHMYRLLIPQAGELDHPR